MEEPRQNSLAITVIIAVRNEERNLRECLCSLKGMDQVFVVDSHSTDRTSEVATELGAEVVQFEYDGGWPKKRNWALRELPIRNDWVLILDADERVVDSLFVEMAHVIQQSDVIGFYIRWKYMFWGRWMRHCWSHGWMLRLFRHGAAEYEDLQLSGGEGWDAEVHENIVADGPCTKLKGYLLHESNQDLSYWIDKQNQFSTWNAARRFEQLRTPMPPLSYLFSSNPDKKRRWMKSVFIRLPGKPTLMFIWLWFFKLGFLDGKAGFYFCRLRAMHELVICAKMQELNLSQDGASRKENAAKPAPVHTEESVDPGRTR